VADYFQPHPKAEICNLTTRVNVWLAYAGTALVESECIITVMGFLCVLTIMIGPLTVMLTIRTWAVWNMDWQLSISLPMFFVLCWGPVIKILFMFTNSLESRHHILVNHGRRLMINVFYSNSLEDSSTPGMFGNQGITHHQCSLDPAAGV
jgi:hypothetical protein